jgi:uncharacterized protein
MIIDAHVHVLDAGHWPDAWWDYVADQWASAKTDRTPGMVRDTIEAGLIDPDGGRMVRHLDDAGIDAAVVLPIDWGPDYPARSSIDDAVRHAVACARRHPGRLIPFAGIDPRRDGAAERLERWITEDGVRGLKLYPSCGWWPSDDRAMDLYEICDRHQLPVLFHTGDPLPLLDVEYSRPKHLLPVVEAFPALRLWLGHAGAPDEWEDAVAVVATSDAAALELSVWLWDDSTQSDEIALARRVASARDQVGIERIIFGSDHVSGTKERRPGFLTNVTSRFRALAQTAEKAGVKLTHGELAQILGLNAARDLGISPAANDVREVAR